MSNDHVPVFADEPPQRSKPEGLSFPGFSPESGQSGFDGLAGLAKRLGVAPLAPGAREVCIMTRHGDFSIAEMVNALLDRLDK